MVGGGTSDYTELSNKPKINGVTLSGNKSTSDLGIDIPTKVSDLQNDSGFIVTESDPTVPAAVKNITSTDISNWNNKQDALTAGTNITIDANNVISATGGGSNYSAGTNIDITNNEISTIGDTIKQITASSVRIWDLNPGVYLLPEGADIYYYGATGTQKTSNDGTSILYISSESSYYKTFVNIGGSSDEMYIDYGYSTSTEGFHKAFILSNQMTPKAHASTSTTYGVGTTNSYGHCKTINNLNQSSHTNGYALSAYQGYLLNQNKQDKITYGTTDLTPGVSDLDEGQIYLVYE